MNVWNIWGPSRHFTPSSSIKWWCIHTHHVVVNISACIMMPANAQAHWYQYNPTIIIPSVALKSDGVNRDMLQMSGRASVWIIVSVASGSVMVSLQMSGGAVCEQSTEYLWPPNQLHNKWDDFNRNNAMLQISGRALVWTTNRNPLTIHPVSCLTKCDSTNAQNHCCNNFSETDSCFATLMRSEILSPIYR